MSSCMFVHPFFYFLFFLKVEKVFCYDINIKLVLILFVNKFFC
jgi:hypothetical protein